MTDVNILMDPALLARARDYAQKRGETLDEFICDLVAKHISGEPGTRTRLTFDLADRFARCSIGGPMGRAEAHDRT